MSLINQVLREVDQRHAHAPPGAPSAAGHARPAPARSQRRPLLLLALAGLAGAALAGWWLNAPTAPPASPAVQAATEPAAAGYAQGFSSDKVAQAETAPAPTPAPAQTSVSPEPTSASPEPTSAGAGAQAAADARTEAAASGAALASIDSARPSDPLAPQAAGDTELAAVTTETAAPAGAQPAAISTPVPAPTRPSSAAAALPVPVLPALADAQQRQADQAAAAAADAAESAASGQISIRRADRPAHADDPFQAAQRALARGQSGLAEQRLQELLAAQAGHVEARRLLAMLLIAGGRRSAAEETLQQGLAQTSAPALAGLLARLLADRDQLDQALAVLEAHAPALAGDVEYHLLYAALLRQAGRHAEALAHYQSLTRVAPASAAAWVGLGASHEALEQPDAARAAYQQAVRLDQPELAAFARSRLRALQ